MRWREIQAAPIAYLITTAPDGTTRLSKRWHWGNIPSASMEAAEREAEADAGGRPFTVERKRIRFGSQKEE